MNFFNNYDMFKYKASSLTYNKYRGRFDKVMLVLNMKQGIHLLAK